MCCTVLFADLQNRLAKEVDQIERAQFFWNNVDACEIPRLLFAFGIKEAFREPPKVIHKKIGDDGPGTPPQEKQNIAAVSRPARVKFATNFY